VARLFRAIAYAERVHATNHLRELGGIGDTVANLAPAMGGENHENTEMYPAFDAVARLQAEKRAMRSIRYALEAEKIHEVMYREAKESVTAASWGGHQARQRASRKARRGREGGNSLVPATSAPVPARLQALFTGYSVTPLVEVSIPGSS
jgi:hypothetical protein